ncbi:unnamed protein product, partial [Ilex paraguariensis]
TIPSDDASEPAETQVTREASVPPPEPIFKVIPINPLVTSSPTRSANSDVQIKERLAKKIRIVDPPSEVLVEWPIH